MSLDELYATAGRIRTVAYENNRFLAAMQGVDLDEQLEKSAPQERDPNRPRTYAEIAADAQKRIATGKTDVSVPLTEEDDQLMDDLDLSSLGITIERG